MASGIDWSGDRVGHRDNLIAVEKRKTAFSCRESNHDSSVVWPLTYSLVTVVIS
jgi:hypothetical protein